MKEMFMGVINLILLPYYLVRMGLYWLHFRWFKKEGEKLDAEYEVLVAATDKAMKEERYDDAKELVNQRKAFLDEKRKSHSDKLWEW